MLAAIGGSGPIRPDGPEIPEALDQRELDEAIALSLATSATQVMEPRIESPIPKATPPPASTNQHDSRPVPVADRAVAAVSNRVPAEPTPPPDQSPTLRHRGEARRRIANPPTLFLWPEARGRIPRWPMPFRQCPIRSYVFARFSLARNGSRIARAFPGALLATRRRRVPRPLFSKAWTNPPMAKIATRSLRFRSPRVASGAIGPQSRFTT